MTWWERAEAVDLAVACSGARHRLRWAGGQVHLADHPDLDAELALVAFGGEEPACLALRRLWDDAVADGGFLAEWVDETHLGPARLSWLTMALDRMANEGFHEFLRNLPPKRAERMGQFLHRFPRLWLDRAAATVSAAVVDGGGVVCGDAAGLVPVAVANRVRTSFVTAVGGSQLTVGTAALLPLSIEVGATGASGAEGRLRGPGRGVRLTVGPDWLHRVWGAGLATLDGHLVLAAGAGPGPVDHEVAVVTWGADGDDGGPRPIVRPRIANHDGRRWRLRC